MTKFAVLAVCGALAVSACAPQGPALGPDGKPLPQVYRTTDEAAVAYRLLDSVNSLRQARGAAPMEMNAELRAAAATHSRDMSVQNRPWHFGSDGSSPLVRVQRAGYPGKLMGELISETYQTELETLAAWMAQPDTREVVLDPKANQMGFARYQEPAGKIWWTMVTGAGASANAPFQIAGQ